MPVLMLMMREIVKLLHLLGLLTFPLPLLSSNNKHQLKWWWRGMRKRESNKVLWCWALFMCFTPLWCTWKMKNNVNEQSFSIAYYRLFEAMLMLLKWNIKLQRRMSKDVLWMDGNELTFFLILKRLIKKTEGIST